MLYDSRTFGVLYPECILVLALVCLGGAILGTTLLAILETLNASVSRWMYGTYVASHCPMLVCVVGAHLYTLSFNTYAWLPLGVALIIIWLTL
jgi:ABC-type amino acid transport system permease subunit